MSTHDPISDMLSRIRNAVAVNKREINLPHSKMKETVAKILMDNGFLASVSVSGEIPQKSLDIVINLADGNARITEIGRLSTPGRRLYTNADKIPVVKRGRGLVVVSTSKGVMTGQQAKKQRLGGELICEVY